MAKAFKLARDSEEAGRSSDYQQGGREVLGAIEQSSRGLKNVNEFATEHSLQPADSTLKQHPSAGSQPQKSVNRPGDAEL
jgi:hypothetical protein